MATLVMAVLPPETAGGRRHFRSALYLGPFLVFLRVKASQAGWTAHIRSSYIYDRLQLLQIPPGSRRQGSCPVAVHGGRVTTMKPRAALFFHHRRSFTLVEWGQRDCFTLTDGFTPPGTFKASSSSSSSSSSPPPIIVPACSEHLGLFFFSGAVIACPCVKGRERLPQEQLPSKHCSWMSYFTSGCRK